jgi:hypothetical protein
LEFKEIDVNFNGQCGKNTVIHGFTNLFFTITNGHFSHADSELTISGTFGSANYASGTYKLTGFTNTIPACWYSHSGTWDANGP